MGTEVIKTETPDGGELTRVATTYRETALAFEIDSPEMYDLAADERKRIKALIKEREAQRVSIIKPLDEAKARIMDLFRPGLAILAEAVGLLDSNMKRYVEDQERARREQEKLAREAQEKAAKAAREAADKAALAAAEGNATKAEAKAAQAAAEAVEQAPPPAVVVPETKGTRKTWDFEVTDFAALPDEYKVANDQMLRGMAVSTKGKIDVPGVRFFQKTGIVSR